MKWTDEVIHVTKVIHIYIYIESLQWGFMSQLKLLYRAISAILVDDTWPNGWFIRSKPWMTLDFHGSIPKHEDGTKASLKNVETSIFFLWVKQCHKLHHPLVITIFIGGMFTIPSHGWFMALFYSHCSQLETSNFWGISMHCSLWNHHNPMVNPVFYPH